MTLSAIERPGSLVQDVCQRLATEIRAERNGGDGWLPPERLLAEQMGVSRTVIREATKRLELQGLIEVQHGIGIKVVDKLHRALNSSLAFIIPESGERLDHLIEARQLLEPEIARLAATRATTAQIKLLRKVQSHLLAATHVEEAASWDLEFHRLLARASGNKVLTLFVDSLVELGAESRQRTISRTGVPRAWEHHERIVAAVEHKRPADAAAAMSYHLREAAKDLGLNNPGTKQRP